MKPKGTQNSTCAAPIELHMHLAIVKTGHATDITLAPR